MAAYSWLYITGSTVLTASANLNRQTTALNNGLTDPAHTFSSTNGFGVPDGLYLVTFRIKWNDTDDTSGRLPAFYDGTYYYAQNHPTEMKVTSPATNCIQEMNYLVQTSGGTTYLGPAVTTDSTLTSDRTIASGNSTVFSVRQLA